MERYSCQKFHSSCKTKLHQDGAKKADKATRSSKELNLSEYQKTEGKIQDLETNCAPAPPSEIIAAALRVSLRLINFFCENENVLSGLTPTLKSES